MAWPGALALTLTRPHLLTKAVCVSAPMTSSGAVHTTRPRRPTGVLGLGLGLRSGLGSCLGLGSSYEKGLGLGPVPEPF